MSKEDKKPALLSPVCRISYPNLVTAKQIGNQGDPKFSAAFLFDKAAQNSKEFKALQDAVEKAIAEKWPGGRPRKLKLPFLTVDDLDQVPQGYDDDVVFIRTTSKNRPQVVHRDPNVEVDPNDVYPGLYVRASLRVYAWEHKEGGKGVSFGLGNIQVVKDGERFGGGANAADEFSALPDDEMFD